ncbi:MAG TPA: PAS domain S-box protein [Nitrococcus sp.]|nr:PAS domain S-box protein [Nitrococcus sp.]
MNLQALERFAAAFPEPILLVSSDGRVHGANPAAIEAYQLSRPLPAGFSLSRLVDNPADDVQRYLHRCAHSRQPVPCWLQLKAAQRSGEALRIEGSVVSPAATGKPAIIVLRERMQAADDSSIAILKHQIEALNEEITARKQARAELLAHKEWLRVTLESIGDAVIATDPQGGIVFMNPVSERLTGWTEAEAVGHPLEEIFRIIHEKTGEMVEDPCRKVIRTGRVMTLANHTALIDRFGRQRPIEDSAAPIRDEAGRLFGVVLVFHDVTAQRQAEQELKTLNETLEQRVLERTAEADQRAADLRASEERLAMAIEASRAGYYEHSIPFGHGYVSPRWARLLGYKLNELPPKPQLQHWWEKRLHAEDRPRVLQSYRDFIAGERDHQDIEYRIRHRDDEWRWQRLVSHAVHDQSAEQARVAAGLVFDITAQKQAEEKLRKLNAALEMRAVQLRALAAQLTHAEQSERRRLALLLHDHLQQILVAARLNLSALQNSAEEPALRQGLAAIEALIHEAIEASRSLTVELSPAVLHEGSLANALRWLAHWMGERHGLQVQVQTNDAEISEDEISEHLRVLLFQTARELLFNVVKHAGVNQAFIRFGQQADCIMLEVMDKGVGFCPETAVHGQLDHFGLFSVRERMEACGGGIEIASAAGQGTRIRLSAPLQPAAAEAQKSPPPRTPLATSSAMQAPAATLISKSPKIRIMLVDDDAGVRRELKSLLAKEPDITIVAEAANGMVAVEMARQLHPDAIIMDISMPLLNGIEATRLITRELSSVRVVVFSIHSTETIANTAREAGAAICLDKSSRVDELLRAIRGEGATAWAPPLADLQSVIGRADQGLEEDPG